MEWLVSTLGGVVVAVALRDVFHTLWHPSGRGSLSRLTNATLWWVSQHADRQGRLSSLTGPLAMASIIVIWALLVVVGWALVYWPHLPEAFAYQLGQSPRAPLLDALYLSMVAVATLGFGDIVPVEGWLQIAVPLEALIGFALLSASVSWVLQIYPALTRRRALAIRLTLLYRSAKAVDIRDLDPAFVAQLLESIATDLIRVRVDFTQYNQTYYFRDNDESSSLPAMMAYAEQLSEFGTTANEPDVRLASRMLRAALDDLAVVIDEQFLHTGATPTEVLAAYAADCGVSQH